MPRGSVVVTDSALRTALYAVRCLGRHGVRVTVAERPIGRWSNLGALSRYAHRSVTIPDVRLEPDAAVDALLTLAAEHDVVLPTGMQTMTAVATHRAAFLDRGGVLVPERETLLRADRTQSLLDLAGELGIPTPARFGRAASESIEEFAARVPLPAIVKLGVEAGLPPSGRYAIARTQPALRSALERLTRIVADPIVQELVRGPGVGFEAVYGPDGRLAASFCHRRLREYPISGGPSTFCESAHLPEVAAMGQRLLDALGWIGLAMVEFKIDETTGTPKLMEINPRPWGSMELAIVAGVEFPWLAYQLAAGHPPPAEPPAYLPGVRLRFLGTDVRAMVQAARAEGSLATLLRGLGGLLDPRVRDGVLRVADPLPSLAYLLKGARALSTHGAPTAPAPRRA